MLITDIPRIKPGVAATTLTGLAALESERGKIATRAADLLGYRTLANVMTGRSVVASETGKLTEALRSLEMDVLDTPAVITYQLEEAARLTRVKIVENFAQWCVGWFTASTWSHSPLADYDKPIPEFVLDKAIRIKEALPEVEFHVQFINEPKADPFLIARVGKEIYYIEAWDEPRFEGSL